MPADKGSPSNPILAYTARTAIYSFRDATNVALCGSETLHQRIRELEQGPVKTEEQLKLQARRYDVVIVLLCETYLCAFALYELSRVFVMMLSLIYSTCVMYIVLPPASESVCRTGSFENWFFELKWNPSQRPRRCATRNWSLRKCRRN